MINLRSPIVVLFASLIVSTSGDVVAMERTANKRLSIVRMNLGEAERQRWVSAIGADRTEQINLMLDQYEPGSLIDITASNGKNALMVASKKGDLALAKKLFESGADIHARTQTDGTAFMFAVLGNNRDVAEWLLSEQADIHVVGSNGWTALTIAAAKGNVRMLAWLIEQGADAQVRDVYRYTPLLRSVDNGFEKTAQLLLMLPDTDVNALDEYENTALHHAVSSGNRSMVEMLLKHNANPDIRNRDGITARELAMGNPDLHLLFR